ncbi:MAG: polynucleotide adenylyltransferase PcnB [Nevskiales bacterium]
MSSLRIVPRAEHSVSRSQITPGALKTLYMLKDAGYDAYVVGGGIRDLLLGVQPKDFDVATSAHPEEIKRVFRNSRLIGRRFRLAHVRFGQEIVEVATFRAGHHTSTDSSAGHLDESGRILRDNVYGSLEEDAWRRDFTINALYYGVNDFAIRDYVGGMEDLQARRLRLIGDAEVRYIEDPVRMLRAVRLAAKLHLSIDPATEAPLYQLGHLLAEVPPARLFDECLKIFFGSTAHWAFAGLRQFGLLRHMFPQVEARLAESGANGDLQLIEQALRNTAERIKQQKPVTPYFLFAALLWPAARPLLDSGESAGGAEIGSLVAQQVQRITIPKRFTIPMREIWDLQPRFHQREGKRPLRLLSHPRFRAAYDFLLLRAACGQAEPGLAEWWTELQAANPDQRAQIAATQPDADPQQDTGPQPGKRRRRRRGGRGRRRPADTPAPAS